MRRELTKLQTNLGGIRNLTKAPSVVWVVDTKKEHLAIDEAKKLNIPVVAILDTNCDPDEVDFPIPGNDDAIRAVNLLTRVIADAVAEGLMERHNRSGNNDAAAAEPMAEWERELLQGNADAEPDAAPAAEAAAPEAAPEAPAAEEAPAGLQAPIAEEVPEAVAPATEAAADTK